MNHQITDAGVAGLPIHEGRAELLEEIMATTVIESTPPSHDDGPSRHRRWLTAVGAAAAVAAVLAGTAWLGQQRDGTGRGSLPVTATPSDVATGDRAFLDAPGWQIRHVDQDPSGGEVSYVRGEQQLDVHWRPADQYDGYVADRNDLGAPSDVELLGLPSLLWAYSDDDHTVIRPVEEDATLEVRGTGMSRPAFLELLGQLRLADDARLTEHVDATERVSPEDEAYQEPPVPVLITAEGWAPQVDRDGGVSWIGPQGQRLDQVWISGVDDPFTYDRYLDMAHREEVTLLGEPGLVVDWEQGRTTYRVAATSPLTGDTILVLEAADMDKADFLQAVGSVEVVAADEYERVVRAAIG